MCIFDFETVPLKHKHKLSCSVCPCADGELFTATTADFKGAQPQISRHFSKDGRPDVSQDLSVSLLEGK